MKTFKLGLLALVALFIILVIYQNSGLFTHKESFSLNLVAWKYKSGEILLSMYFVAFFLMGLLLSYFHGLSARFKARHEMRTHLDKITKLEEEIKVLQSLSRQQVDPPSQETPTV
jgi:uncharacterized integral membrane protein